MVLHCIRMPVYVTLTEAWGLQGQRQFFVLVAESPVRVAQLWKKYLLAEKYGDKEARLKRAISRLSLMVVEQGILLNMYKA